MRQNKKNQGIGDVVSNFGFAFEIFKVIAHAVMAKGGNMQHLRRIVKEPALQRQIADLVVPAGSEADRPFGENEYLVPVNYAPLPSRPELERDFSGENSVSVIFDGRPFQKHASCVGMDETPGDRIFLVEHFGREIESEDAITEMDKQGYRPATHLEAIAFAKAHPEFQRQFWIVALGSFAMDDGNRRVAVLGADGDGRFLSDGWFDRRWHAELRFLFLRK